MYNSPRRFLRRLFGLSLLALLGGTPTSSAQTWSGATSADWGTASNWSTAVPGSGATALFNDAGNGNTTITLSANQPIGSIVFDKSPAAYSFSGSEFVFDAAGRIRILDPVQTSQTFNTPLQLLGIFSTSNNSLVGTLTLNGAITLASGGTAGLFTLGGAGATVLSGPITAGSVSGVLFNGSGTTTLNSATANGYTGGTTINGGTVVLDFSNLTVPTDLIAATSSLTLGGGTTRIRGNSSGSTSQTFNGLSLTGGASLLGDVNGGTATTIKLGTLNTTATGSTLLLGTAGANITGLAITTTTNRDTTNNNYGGRLVFFNGTTYDWATTVTASAPYTFSALGTYTTLTTTLATGTNVRLIATLGNRTASGVFSTLKFDNPAAATTLPLVATLMTISSGGILTTGSQAVTISGSTGATRLTAGNSSGAYDLIFQQYSSATMTVSAVIGNNGTNPVSVVKAGTGTLVLSGTNTYSGLTYINGGILSISSEARLGTAPAIAATNIVINGGTLLETTAFSMTAPRQIAIGASGATFSLPASGNFNIGGVIKDLAPGAGPLNLIGVSGGLYVPVGQNTYSGGTHFGINTRPVANSDSIGSASTGDLVSGPFGVGPIYFEGATMRAPSGAAGGTIGNALFLNADVTFVTGGGVTRFLNFNGPAMLTGTRTITNNHQGDLIFSGNINEVSPGQAFNLSASSTATSTMVLSGQNTYSGGTTVPVSILALGSSSSNAGAPGGLLTSGPVGTGMLTLSGGQIRATTTADVAIGNPVTISADTTFVTVGSEKSLTFNGAVTLGTNVTLTGNIGTNVVGAAVNFNGIIGESASGLGVTKAGTGTVVFAGANSYTGTTTINSGTLVVAATGSFANPTITAQTGGTLALRGNVTLGSGSVTPLLTLVGNTTPATAGGLNLQSGAINTLTFNSATPATPVLSLGDGLGSPANLSFDVGVTADQIVFASGTLGTFNAGGAIVNINGLGGLTGTSQVLISAPNNDLTTGTTFVLGNVSGNLSNYLLSLNVTPTALFLMETLNTNPVPATVWYKGNQSAFWTQTTPTGDNNFTTDPAGTLVANQLPGAITDVHYFATGATNLASFLGASFTIKSLTVDAASTTASSLAGGGGTLTIAPAAATAGITIEFGAAAFTLSAPLVVGSAQSWTNNSTAALTISGTVTGTSGVTINGSGVVTITDSNNYVGASVTLSSGFGSGPLTLATAAVLNLQANGDGTTAAQVLNYASPLIVTVPTVTVNADYQAATGGTGKTIAFPSLTIGSSTFNAVGGSHGYTLGLGNIVLTDTATGTTTIGSSTNSIWVTMNNVTGAATTGNITTFTLGGIVTSANSVVTGIISDGVGGGTLTLTKSGVSLWTMSGTASNTYTGGTTVTGGQLILGKSGGALAIPGNITIGGGGSTANVVFAGSNQINPTATVTLTGADTQWAYLILQGQSQTIGTIVETTPGFGVIETRESAGSFGTSTVTFNVASGTQSYQGYYRDINTGYAPANPLALVKDGAGTLAFGAVTNGTGSAGTSATSHNYSGGTTVNNGVLLLTSANALGASGSGNLAVNGGATFAGSLDVNGFSQVITGLNGIAGTVAGSVFNNATGTSVLITLGTGNNAGSYAGNLVDHLAGTGTIALTKVGTATQILSGTVNYTGTTTISAGVLSFRGNAAFPSATVFLDAATLEVLKDGTGNNGIIATIPNNIVLTASGATIAVGNNGSGNTGNTIAFGTLTIPTAIAATTVNFTGANGYNVSFNGGLTLIGGTGQTLTLNAASASVIINGNIINPMNSWTLTSNFDTLLLNGSAPGSLITGSITDATGTSAPMLGSLSGSFANGGYTRITKAGTGTWTLAGAGSAYTGFTTVQAGTLQSGVNNALSTASLQGLFITATGAGITAQMDFAGFNQTLNGVTAITLGGTTTTSTPKVIGTGSTLSINGNVAYTSTNNPVGALIAVDALNFGGGTRTFDVGNSTTAAIDLDVTSNLSNGTLIKSNTGTLRLSGTVGLSQIVLNGGVLDLNGGTFPVSFFTLQSGSLVNVTLTATAAATLFKQGPGTLTLNQAYATGFATAVTVNQGVNSTTSNPATSSNLTLNYVGTGVTTFFDANSTLVLGGPANSLAAAGQLTLTGDASATNAQSFTSTLIDGGANSIVATSGTGGAVNLTLGTLSRSTAGTLNVTLPATGTVTLTNPGTPGTLLTGISGTAFATVSGDNWAANSTTIPGSIVSAAVAGPGGASIMTNTSDEASLTGHADILADIFTTASATVSSLRFNTGAFTLTLAGGLTVTNGGILFGSGSTGATLTGGTLVPGTGKDLVVIVNLANTQTYNLNSVIADGLSGPTTVTYRANTAGGTTGSILTLGANNTYTGPTYITQGRVQVIAAGITTPFGTGANAIVYVDGNADGQFFTNQNTTIANPFVIIGTGFNEAATRRGAIRLDSTATELPVLSGPITLLGDSSIGNSAVATAGFSNITGNIGTSAALGATSFALTKVGTGVLKLSGVNSQTATNIAGGVLNINGDAALGTALAVLTFTTTSTLQSDAALTLQASRGIVIGSGVTGSVDTASFATDINGTITGAGSFTKTGAGTLTLANTNAYVGTTTILGGTLAVGVVNALPIATPVVIGDTNGNTGTLAVNFNQTIRTLTVSSNTTTASSLAIPNGMTLTVNSDVFIGSNTAALTTTNLTTSGGGSLVVNNPAANGSFVVGGVTTAASVGSLTTANLSGLSNLTINLDPATGIVRINPTNGNNVNGRFSTLILPSTGEGTTTITANTLNIGDSSQGNQAGQVNTLKLGSGVNTLNVNTINIGTGGRDQGQILFNSPSLGSLVVRNAAGTGRAALNIGTGTAATGVTSDDLVDLSGHNADLLLSTLNVGTQPRSTTHTNTFTFTQGTLDATTATLATTTQTAESGNGATLARVNNVTMNLGGGTVTFQNGISNIGLITGTSYTVAVNSHTMNGVLNISDGTVTIGATTSTSVTLATINVTGATNVAPLAANGTINITGGAVTFQGNIVTGGITGTSTGGVTTLPTVNLAGGSIDLSGKNIGTAALPIVFTAASGTLRNMNELNGGGTLAKSTAGTLVLAGTNAYTGATSVNQGSLIVNGTNTGLGTVNVNTTGLLGGSGTIAAPVFVNVDSISPGGILRGDSGIGLGALSVNNNITLFGNPTLGATIRTTVSYAATNSATASRINLTGGGSILDLGTGGGLFQIDLVNSGLSPLHGGEMYILVLATVATPGNIQLNTTTLPGSTIIPQSAYTLTNDLPFGLETNYSLAIDTTGTQLQLTITPVPEPMCLLGFALVGLLVVRK
ncbi:autotransporter-associated beta strand repeat-containing protein [soil metagenome]